MITVELGGLFIVGWSLRLLQPSIKGMAGEWKVRQALSWQKATALNNVIIADDRGLTQIDHLVLTPAGIVILETKNYAGKLYDRGRKRSWTQYIGKQQNQIHNPLDQNYRHRKALAFLVPGAPLLDFVVLAGSGRFSGVVPQGVLTISELNRKIRELNALGSVPESLQNAWQTLQPAARTDSTTRRAHLRSIPGGTEAIWRSGAGKWGLLLGVAMVVAGIV
ncbi:nuclease-related domain-containing protein [Acidithiobacillus ferrianus]|uniref:nuclease-related domain-containing protein n=1 Tax=Acidithiobacillus ferrianus TaxID=2678518 RepID=UPI0034E512D6